MSKGRNREIADDLGYLRRKDYDVVEIADQQRAVEAAWKRPIPHTIRIAEIVPLALRGDPHRTSRKGTAALVSRNKAELEARLPGIVAENFQCLSQSGHHDLLNRAITPLVDQIIAIVSGLEIDTEDLKESSSVFDPAASPKRRLLLERAAESILTTARQSYPDDSEDVIGARVALAVQGRDALVGTIARSLDVFIRSLEGRPLNSAPFDEVPIATGVPYAWRQKVDDETNDVGGTSDPSIVEIRLDTLEREEAKGRLALFGLGAHTCVGKAISLSTFTVLSDFLATCTNSVRSVEIEIERNHVLNVPSKMMIDVTT